MRSDCCRLQNQLRRKTLAATVELDDVVCTWKLPSRRTRYADVRRMQCDTRRRKFDGVAHLRSRPGVCTAEPTPSAVSQKPQFDVPCAGAGTYTNTLRLYGTKTLRCGIVYNSITGGHDKKCLLWKCQLPNCRVKISQSNAIGQTLTTHRIQTR